MTAALLAFALAADPAAFFESKVRAGLEHLKLTWRTGIAGGVHTGVLA